MNAHKSNLIHAVALFLVSMYAYFDAMNREITQLIPLMLGVVLLSLNNGVLYKYKEQVRAAFVITLISFVILINMFLTARRHDDQIFMTYYGIMMSTALFSLFFLVKSVFVKLK